jgi:hypothetical protein
MTTNDDKGPINLVCPRCSRFVPNNETPGAYPGAMTRWGGRQIEICSQCGQDEAMAQFTVIGTNTDPMLVVHPTKGVRPWDNPPKGLT